MDEYKISFTLIPHGQFPLGFICKIDQQIIFETDQLINQEQIVVNLPEDETKHKLKFILTGKTTEHTKIDNQGNITSDNYVCIDHFKFDDIDTNFIFNQQAVYYHDFNGTKDPVTERFFGIMGCNGTVELEFTTPVYSWLLEQM